MKFSTTLVLSSIVAIAASKATTTSVALTPQESCVIKCDAGDVNCQADCVGAPHPDDAGANATTECSANCDQGDGSEADTEKYAQCLKKCSDEFYATTGGAGPSPATVPAGVSTSAAAAGGSSAAAITSAAAAASGSSGSSSGGNSGNGGNSGSGASASSGASGTAGGSSSNGTATGAAASSTNSGGAAAYIQVGTSAAGLVGLVMAIFAL